MKPFSLDTYREIIREFQHHDYAVLPLGASSESGKAVYIRHDVDYCLEFAAVVAKVNRELGISACFCLSPRCPLYNLLSDSARGAVRTIRQCRQVVGLHFYLPDDPPGDLDALREMIREELGILRGLVGDPVAEVLSWHNPSVLGEANRDFIDADVPGLLSANHLAAQGVPYMSDSNHRYSVQEWLAAAREGPDRLMVLFHPFQWVYETSCVEEVHAHTWKFLVRQTERAFSTNHVYRGRLPAGLPDQALEDLVRPLREAAQAVS